MELLIGLQQGEKKELAMKDKYKSFFHKHTSTLMNLLLVKKIMLCKWVFRLKTNVNGEIGKYKARVVAKGYSQQSSIIYDYFEKYNSIKTKLAINVVEDLDIH